MILSACLVHLYYVTDDTLKITNLTNAMEYNYARRVIVSKSFYTNITVFCMVHSAITVYIIQWQTTAGLFIYFYYSNEDWLETNSNALHQTEVHASLR